MIATWTISQNQGKKTLFTLSPYNMWMVLSMKNKSFGKYEKGA
jgi:hypothetical protein